jgi:hypothetical protein
MATEPTYLLQTLDEAQMQLISEFAYAIQTQLSVSAPDNHTLARFLVARRFDIPKATEMYRKYLQWQVEFGVDELSTFIVPELPSIKEYYPHGYHKTDKYGRPVYIERVGQLDIDKLLEATTEERLLKYCVREYEKVHSQVFPACSEALGTNVRLSIVLVDLNGMTMKHLSKKVYGFLKIISGITQEYYPEILHKMFIVNAPKIFTIMWSIIKPWIDKRTKAKISIIGNDFLPQLLEYIDADDLPSFLGGNCMCPNGCICSNAGPWNPFGTPTTE